MLFSSRLPRQHTRVATANHQYTHTTTTQSSLHISRVIRDLLHPNTSPPPLRTSHTPRPHTYTHTKQVELAHSIISTPHHAHPLTKPLPDQPRSPSWSATPLYYLTLLLRLTSALHISTLPMSPLPNHATQPHRHQCTSHITHQHDSHTPTSTTHQPPTRAHTHAHTHASPPMPSAHLTYSSVVRLGT